MKVPTAWLMMGVLVVAATARAASNDSDAGQEVRSLDAEQRAAIDQSIDRALAFLKTAQQPDGGWAAFEGSDPAITALVAKCFAQHPAYGVKHPVTQKAFEFILKSRQDDGGIYIPDRGLKNYYTSVAVMALSLSDDAEVKKAVGAAQRFLTELQWDESEDYKADNVFYGGAGYGHGKRPDLSNTQMMLEALRQSGLPPEHPTYRKAMAFISRCQMLPETNDQPFAKGGDGGFIYSPANGGESKAGTVGEGEESHLRSYGSMTYAGLKSMIYAGVNRDDVRVQRAFEWIRQHYTLDVNPNMPADQAQQGLYYYFHTFAKALEAYGDPVIEGPDGAKHVWRADLAKKLLELQKEDGSWVNEADRWWESNPHLVTAYSVLALQTVRK